MTKQDFVDRCLSSINESVEIAKQHFESLLKSGTMDLEDANMIDVKAAVKAFFLKEADQRNPPEKYKSQFNQTVRNFQSSM